jgi:hypothetical protein
MSRDTRTLARASQAALRSVEISDGPVSYYDEDGVPRLQVGNQGDGTYTVIENNGTPPPQPTEPDVNQVAGGVEIVWDGTFMDANTPIDFSHVEIHAATESDTPATDATQIGTFTSTSGGNYFLPLSVEDGVRWFSLVTVNRSGVESTRSSVVGQEAGIIKAQTDGLAPPPVATLLGIPGPGMVFLRWTPPLNNDPVDFQVYGSPTPGFTPNPSLLIGTTGSTSYTVRQLADGVVEESRSLSYDVDYYYQVLAFDADGVASSASPELGIRPVQISGADIAARTVVGEHMVAGTFTGDVFAGQIVLATTLSTGFLDEETGDIVGRRVDINTSGIRLFDSAGNMLVNMPTGSNEAPFFKGEFEIEVARVLNGLSIESINNEIARNAVVTLNAGVARPKTGPGLEVIYDTVQLDTTTAHSARPGSLWDHGTFALTPSEITALGWHVGAQKWLVSQNRGGRLRVWVFNTDGTVADVPDGVPDAGSPWVDDWLAWNDIYSLWGNAAESYAYNMLGRFGTTLRAYVRAPDGRMLYNNIPNRVNEDQRPIACPDFGTATLRLLENDNSGTRDNLTLRRYNATSIAYGNMTTVNTRTYATGTGRGSDMAGAAVGTFDLGGVTKVATTSRGKQNNIRINEDSAGADYLSEHTFPTSSPPVGFAWNGTNFYSVNTSGQLTKYSTWTWTDAANDVHVAYSWYDSDTAGGGVHETNLGPRSRIVMPKRAKLKVNLPLVPDDGGTDSPDQWRLYARRLATVPTDAQMLRQATGGSATASSSYIMTSIASGAAITPIPFPVSTPAKLRAESTDTAGKPLFEVDGFGQGRWPWIMPPGGAILWPSAAATPAGFLKLSGQVVSQTTYAEIFGQYGTSYNTGGEGTGNFRLPNVTVSGMTGIVKI